MKVKLKVCAVLQNPTGVWEEEIPTEMPDPSYFKTAVIQTIVNIQRGGGLYREIDETTTQFIPMCRVVDVNISLSTVGLADNLDMAQALAESAHKQSAAKKVSLA
jgi:hypothetical protein